MTAFDNKEKAEENKYARDKEMEFKVYARYHSLLAAWVSDELKLDAAKKEEYKNTLISFGVSKHDDDTLLHKILQEFHTAKVSIAEHVVREKMHGFMKHAVEQIKGK